MTTIFYVTPGGGGWGPINALAHELARCLEAELLTVSDRELSRLERVPLLVPRRRGDDVLIVLATAPEALNFVTAVPGVRRRFRMIVGWVIDSWWTDRIPVAVTRGHLYDRLLVTEKEVVPDWHEATGLHVSWLPLGANVLGAIDQFGSAGDVVRTTDVLRMGRMPVAWSDNEITAHIARRAGLAFTGGAPVGATDTESYGHALAADADARVVLAFSNRVSAGSYTHPSREYVTSRWLDALACGTAVAGVRPTEPGSDRLLWPGATLDVDAEDPETGIAAISAWLADWTPQRAADLQLEALRRLDWRWRFDELATLLDLSSPTLDGEIARLEGLIAAQAA